MHKPSEVRNKNPTCKTCTRKTTACKHCLRYQSFSLTFLALTGATQMAARYGASSFSRGARSAFNSFRNSSSASQTARPPPRLRNPFENGSPSINRRRLAQTMVPLHAAVSSALLVTRLSISSRSSHSISRGSYKETLTHTVGLITSRSSTWASGPFLLFLSDAAGVGSSSDIAGLKPVP